LPCINSPDLLAVAVICGDATLIRKLYRKIINSVVWQANYAKILAQEFIFAYYPH
jgi:hypothetical protein